MKLKLTVVDRIVLLELLPQQGTFLALKEIREMREILGLSEDEIVGLEVVQEGKQLNWNGEKEAAAGPKEVTISDFLLQETMKNIRLMDRKASLPEKCFDTLVKLGYDGCDPA